jgi:hypothetical protein
MKATINFTSKNINSSNKKKNDGKKDIDFLYINDDKLVFALNYDFDDEDEDEKDDDKLKTKRNRRTINNIIGDKIIKNYIYSDDNLF